VVGAGMAGLPAARALADFFEHIVVLERDTMSASAPEHRRRGIRMGSLAGGQRARLDPSRFTIS
jgi:2-polyprenyl-6-methoxyphenol hydroxylase-like FAD-dependent oxidoreductase